jgi:hypothetical protein
MTDPTANQDTPDSRPDQGLADNTNTGGAADPKGEDLKDGVDGEERSFHTSTAEANRSIEEGNGVGQEELDAQADPSRDQRQNPLGEDASEQNARPGGDSY